MGFFSNLRSDRLITQIKSTDKPLSEETLKSVAKLKSVGAGAIEPIILALADADKNATVALVDKLAAAWILQGALDRLAKFAASPAR